MSMFSVGEVAVFFCPGREYHGRDVLITQGLHFAEAKDETTGEMKYGIFYGVQPLFLPPIAQGYVVDERILRKKRPPQDWSALCKLDEVPTVAEKST